ncbi:oligoendopeptidase F, partial [Oenococcus oeni AWRIB568]
MKYSQNWNIDVVFPGIDSPELKTAFKKTENKNQALTAILASLKKNSSNEKIIEAADALQTAEAKLDTIAFYLTAWSSTNYGKAEAGPKFDLL